jgi:hypothetical protein
MKIALRNSSAAFALAIATSTYLAPAALAQADDVTTTTTSVVVPLHGDINPFHGDINPFHGDIDPFHGDINPFHGDIGPFHGDINPFHGDIDPFHGDINPFYGDISPFHGDINPFYGNLHSFHGDINPFYGDISPFWGDISPFWGDINPFHGDISPFHGDINPFHGDINPFHGDISPFHGDISPFWGDINPFHGDIDPFHGDISPFWGDIGPFWGDINAFWGDIDPFSTETSADYGQLSNDLNTVFTRAEGVFGARISTVTGQSFRDGFLKDLLDRYGIDLNNPASLEALDARARSAFFMDFYDGLMDFTDYDRVDHWMATVNWSPALSQFAGGGEGVTVGMLDFRLPYDAPLDIRRQRGTRLDLEFNHGFAVAGLIAGQHDGEDIMGVAPNVELSISNPFDDSLTANWSEVRWAMRRLLWDWNDVDVVNMSMGVSGWTLHPEWAGVLGDWFVEWRGSDTLFVVAAGNDGLSQTVDINWSGVETLDNLLVVGSVGPTNWISSFSNRPGTACLTVNGACQPGHRLMDRFLVAPGELILTWDGTQAVDGDLGTSRFSGTSFAAPLVTGAASLVKSRWHWLEASDLANILLWSAEDLGAPGVDEVYGWGLLDVDAAMSPLDPTNLIQFNAQGDAYQVDGISMIMGAANMAPDTTNAVVVFEQIGDTYRDFAIPLSSVLAGRSQNYLARRADAESQLAEQVYSFASGTSFRDIQEVGSVMTQSGDLQVIAVAAANDPRERSSYSDLPFQAGIRIIDTGSQRELRFGMGEGALALAQQDGFGLYADYRPETGGVAPVLGLASGGAYAMARFELSETSRVSFGITTTDDERLFVNPFTGEESALIDGLSSYRAQAFLADIRHDLSDSVQIQASYTMLNEDTGFLGAQGTGPLAMEGGTQTDALTIGAEAYVPLNLTLNASATMARSRANAFDGGVLQLQDDVISSAFQLTARRDGVLGDRDAMRLSVVQPLHVEQGTFAYTATQVTDRDTGALGIVTNQWQMGGQRPVHAELLYATPLFDGHADLSLFGRLDLTEAEGRVETNELASGARFRLTF